jgi:protein-S-isoprenylcysteine O-methyltransferase Ste14
MTVRQQLFAIFVLPFTVLFAIPLFLFLLSLWVGIPWMILYPLNLFTLALGFALVAVGLAILYKTNQTFARVGKGTLAPWAPPEHFVTVGLYQYVRNPMILGVLLTLIGVAILSGAILIFVWSIGFWVMNHIWFIHWEEPDLERRFGDEYHRYKENVPRWIPRRTAWSLNANEGE